MTVAAHTASVNIPVAILDDVADESAETVVLTLSAGTGYTVGAAGSHTLTIADNDDTRAGEAVRPAVTIAGGSAVTEGADALFTLRADPAPAAALPVQVEIGRERDYVAQGDLGTRTVTIPPGKSSVAFTVATVDDEKPEMTGAVTARVKEGEDSDYAPAPDGAAKVKVHDNDTLFIRVSNARAKEGPGARLAFRVTLSGARSTPVRVRYETRDVTATAGEDYRRKSGKLTFAPGETEKTVRVRVFDDAHDEGKETMELVLSKARGSRIRDGARFRDRVGVGKILNADPMPRAWLARFGRTVAEQALDGIAGRLEMSRVEPEHDGVGGAAGPSFSLTGGRDLAGGSFAFWGRGTHSAFDGKEEALSLDGEVRTGMLGADYARGRWQIGHALSVSEGEGRYSEGPGDGGAMAGRIETLLTAAIPYAALQASERLKLWGAAGYGVGGVTLKPEGAAAVKTDIDWTMAAAGARAGLLEPGVGSSLTLVADALFAPDPLEDRAETENTRRWKVEAAYGFPAFGHRFTGSPHVGIGLATGTRDYTIGWRLTPEARPDAPDFSFGLKATRRESDAQAPVHTAGFEVTARW